MNRLAPNVLLLGLILAGTYVPAPALAQSGTLGQPASGPRDFAYGMPLEPGAPAGLHRLPVPAAVYRHAAWPDLRDLRVFNAAGDAVPHALRRAPEPPPTALPPVELPFFPLRPALTPTGNRGTWSVRIEAGPGTPAIELGAQSARAAQQATTPEEDGPMLGAPTTYLLDLRHTPGAVTALRIELAHEVADHMLAVKLEASDDLERFRPLGDGHRLVGLAHAGRRIQRTTLRFPAVSGGYLRLNCGARGLPAPLSRIVAERAPAAQAIATSALHVRGVARTGAPGIYDFDLGAPMPVDVVDLVLPEDNSLIVATLRSGATPDDQHHVVQARFRRFTRVHGAERNTPLAIGRRMHRHWTLEVRSGGSGLDGTRVPTLVASHRPEQLLFLARGPGPFELAYGLHGAVGTALDADDLLAGLPEDARLAAATSDTRALPERELAGESARRGPPPAPPYRHYLLWALLVAGVAAVLVAAARLGRADGDSAGAAGDQTGPRG